MLRRILLLVWAGIILAACAGGSATPPTTDGASVDPSSTLLPTATGTPVPTQTIPLPTLTRTPRPTATPVIYVTWELSHLLASRESCASIPIQIVEFTTRRNTITPPDFVDAIDSCYGGDPLEAIATEMTVQLGRQYMNVDEKLYLYTREPMFIIDDQRLLADSYGFNSDDLSVNFDPVTGDAIASEPIDSSPEIGDGLSLWGDPGYTTVWAGTATYPRGCGVGSNTPMDYYCKSDPSRSNHYWGNWGNDTLNIAGYALSDGSTSILFDQPARDVVIVWGIETFVDSIQAILADGTLIPMGYTPDPYGTYEYNGLTYSPILPFAESDGRWIHTISGYGWDSHGFNLSTYNPQPCGFLGLGPDNNFIQMAPPPEHTEGLLALFPLYPARNLEYGVYQRGLYAHQIIGIILTQYSTLPEGALICE